MLMVISPAKTLDYKSTPPTEHYTQPDMLQHSAILIEILRKKSPAELSALMSLSEKLAVLNAGRYDAWQPPFTAQNAKQAVFAFMGDVYAGLDAATLDEAEIDYLQQHLRILSGLYGVLRPLDLMQAYRLEMGTRLVNPRGKDLYAFWGEHITEVLNTYLAGQHNPVLINLASQEYFGSVNPQAINGTVITPVFQDNKNGQYKVISFYAKRARGLMARWAAKHAVDKPEVLKKFDSEGYTFNPQSSSSTHWIFRRG